MSSPPRSPDLGCATFSSSPEAKGAGKGRRKGAGGSGTPRPPRRRGQRPPGKSTPELLQEAAGPGMGARRGSVCRVLSSGLPPDTVRPLSHRVCDHSLHPCLRLHTPEPLLHTPAPPAGHCSLPLPRAPLTTLGSCCPTSRVPPGPGQGRERLGRHPQPRAAGASIGDAPCFPPAAGWKINAQNKRRARGAGKEGSAGRRCRGSPQQPGRAGGKAAEPAAVLF